MGDNCTFQWTTKGTVNDFVVYNQTTGTSVAQNSRVSLKRDSIGHTINMTITSIALWDAGNYTLSTTNGVVWENDSSALLFVFSKLHLMLYILVFLHSLIENIDVGQ